MKLRSRSFRPDPSGLEARVLLSGGPVAGLSLAEVTRLASAGSVTVASGRVTGNYISVGQDHRPSDAPWRFDLSGTGTLQGLGKVRMSGSIHFGGFLPAGRPDIVGTITLTNARGSITVRLTGHGGQGQLPNHRFALNATIVSGTGAYHALRGTGAANLAFGANKIVCITAPCPVGGAMTLDLALRRPA